MYGYKQLTKIYESSEVYSFDARTRLVFMSDCHRGDGSWADTFAKNENTCLGALSYYYEKDFTYIEIGDGDELWENKRLSAIVNTHKDVFRALSNFHQDGRLYLIYGNHDMLKRSERFVQNHLHRYYNRGEKKHAPLFPGIAAHEGIVLRYAPTGDEIFIVHGHQADYLNSRLWRLARWLVRNLWRPLEIFGINDPTSAAKNYNRKERTERRLIHWVSKKHKMLIAGHTHRPVFPDAGEPPYFNDGSCVHPGGVTALEIVEGRIQLVKWSVKLKAEGLLYVGREVIAGPLPLEAFFRSPAKSLREKT